jgi:hypothetical protein
MATDFQKVAIVLFIYLTTISSTCKKRIDCSQKNYSFAPVTKAYQDIDSINVNDTIWIELDESTTFRDVQSGLYVDYSNAVNLGFGLTFDKFIGGSISNPGTTPAVSGFSTMLFQGTELTSLQPDRIKSFNFLEESGRYKFKIAVVARTTGIFAIAISNAANVYRRNDGCTKAGFQITFSNTNQHLYFYEQNRPGYTPSVYEQTHMYCFKVK